MGIKIGFAILSYNEPAQLLRLVKTLSEMFCAPPIVCHHNFSQCPVHEDLFPANVRFVHPHIETRWGHITTPLAAMRAFRVLKEHDQPDWFVLLSGSDYPVRPADKIVADLCNADYDAYLDNREIQSRAIPDDQAAVDSGFGRPGWVPVAYDRYCAFHCWAPRPKKMLALSGWFPFQKRHIRHPYLIRWFQFNRPARIFGGAFWFQANRKAIARLLDEPSLPRLVRYYSGRQIPEESLFHTVLCSQSDLRISNDHKRYEDWRGAGIEAHPKWLELEDVPKIVASGAHYARKFRADGFVQEFIDKTVLGI
jgi:hypothetical protein